MAQRYAKLKALQLLLESKPIDPITEQKWNELLFIIRGKDYGLDAWHYLLVVHDKVSELQSITPGHIINCTKYGSIIKYRDNNGKIYNASGWGTDPPLLFQQWITKNYDNSSCNKNTIVEYTSDDIRLCRIQRLIPSQLIGIYRYYHKQAHFHYIRLPDDYQTTLAYRSGIRDYDRFIWLNGVNIENETLDQVTQRFKKQLNRPVEMLVCNPATYHHYKENNNSIHPDLLTVQYLKPVFDISLSDEDSSKTIVSHSNKYCVIQWENTDQICIVSQSLVYKSVEYTKINDICFIEIDNMYKKGIIKFIGSIDQCQSFQNNLCTSSDNSDHCEYQSTDSSDRDTNVLSANTISSERSVIEDLPNELLFELFNYLTIEELYTSLFNLNTRFNNLLSTRSNVSLLYDENINLLIIKSFSLTINHLIIDTSNYIDLNLFENLYSLKISNRNSDHLKQIRSNILPKLVYLSFMLKRDFKQDNELITEIFSNKFQNLRYANLGWIKRSVENWSTCLNLEYISIYCDQLMLIEDILKSCPNLKNLQIHLLHNSSSITNSSSPLFNHSLEKFTLWNETSDLTLNTIDYIFSFISNIKDLYIQTRCQKPFINLLDNLYRKLHHLIRFDCFIEESLSIDNQIGNIDDVHNIALCFQSIKLIKQAQNLRIFATD